MVMGRFLLVSGLILLYGPRAPAQRVYAPHSVLSTGSWYSLSVSKPGIYKIDIPFLSGLGINTNSLASSTIRLFGNGGGMLAESNSGPWQDDLVENAIQVVDGGDGLLNGSDHILFYAPGPDGWIPEPAGARFSHKKNIYTGQSFYYLTIGGTGKRISTAPPGPAPNLVITGFSERYVHELDTVNFLNSGREWYGEEFANAPGKTLTRVFSVPMNGIRNGTVIQLRTECISRSTGSGSRFDIKINDQPAGQILVNPLTGGAYDLFARSVTSLLNGVAVPGETKIEFSYVPGSFNAQGWLNWFEIFLRRNLSMAGNDQLLFRDWLSVGNLVGEFVISDAGPATRVWEVTDPLNPVLVTGQLSGNTFRFNRDCSILREYAAYSGTGFPVPEPGARVANQDLHATSPADLVVVTHPSFLGEAARLAELHRQKEGMRVRVVTTGQVFNEFSSGSPDPSAIKEFVKMYHDRYGNDPASRLKYLLLFGDASFDYRDRITGNTDFVPAWQHPVSLDPLSTYASDDFFGFLDDNEDILSGSVINQLDIGIGRVPAKNTGEAKNYVDKVEAYYSPAALGPWRNNLTFIADDEDGNLHLQDAEIITATAAGTGPEFNQQKIYLDAYPQESGAGGSQYPSVNQAINNQVFNGTLIWNYNGHGGARRLAEETILDQDIVNSWNNPDRLPLFITATCDFAPYDNPLVQSIGENILLRPKTGAIALMTTTRLVFAFSNRVMNNNYLRFALEPDVNGRYRTLGEAVKEAKNFTYQTSGDVANNRKFTLLGDPALTLGFPRLHARITRVNGIPVSQPDTLRAAETVLIEGEVTDTGGNVLTDFNGVIYPSVFDKPQTINTLANDPGSLVTAFQVQQNTLFKGKATVQNGRFIAHFKVPKDINYQFGNGKISLYAEDGTRDAKGAFTQFLVGGAGTDPLSDTTGPDIRPYLNDELFVNGGLSNQQPVLIVKLSDSSGINTAGTGIGHDIVATLDGDNNKYFILNDFYQGDLDSYQSGLVRFQLPELDPGPHVLKIKAWDVLNNPGEAYLEFVVATDEHPEIHHVLNYPNPFTTHTSFWFEHNKPGQQLAVNLQVFTLSGKIIKRIQATINTMGNRSNDLEWDGRDDFGQKVGRGVYFYKLSVIFPGGVKREKIEKLVIF